jgi:hypothetical protein
VTIPPGFYDVHELNAVFESAMEANHHYYVYTPSRQHVFLMKIIYNASESRIELQCFSTTSVADRDIYAEPLIASWTTPEGDHVPVFYIPNSGIQTILGFSAGYYPDILADSAANQRASSYGILSEFPAKLQPSYAIVTYKPNNARFATQGAVSSGDLVVRRKYETISRNALGFANTYGAQMGAAMAYGQSIERYTIKDKIGFPNTRTPIFPKWSPNEMQCAEHGRVVGVCSSA